jgi:hypothetical protein
MYLSVFDFDYIKANVTSEKFNTIAHTHYTLFGNRLSKSQQDNILTRVRARLSANLPFLPSRSSLKDVIYLRHSVVTDKRSSKSVFRTYSRMSRAVQRNCSIFKGFVSQFSDPTILENGVYIMDNDFDTKDETYMFNNPSSLVKICDTLQSIKDIYVEDWVNVSFNRLHNALPPDLAFVKLMWNPTTKIPALFSHNCQLDDFLNMFKTNKMDTISELTITNAKDYSVDMTFILPDSVSGVVINDPGPITITLTVDAKFVELTSRKAEWDEISYHIYEASTFGAALLVAFVCKPEYTIDRVTPIFTLFDVYVERVMHKFATNDFIAISGSKGSGKGIITKKLNEYNNTLVIDSDMYGILIQKLLDSGIDLPKDDYSATKLLAKLLNITNVGGFLSIEVPEHFKSFHESFTQGYINDHPNITLDRLVADTIPISLLRNYLRDMISEASSILTFGRYYTLIGFLRSALGVPLDNKQKIVLFVHCTAELYPTLSDGYLSIFPSFDSFFSTFTRIRDTTREVQCLLYRAYALNNAGIALSVPIVILLECIRVMTGVGDVEALGKIPILPSSQ